MIGTATSVCKALYSVIVADSNRDNGTTSRWCLSAFVSDIVPVFAALLRAHGAADERFASVACLALYCLFGVIGRRSDAVPKLASRANDLLSLLTVVTTVMRTLVTSIDLQLTASPVLRSLSLFLTHSTQFVALESRVTPDTSGLARRLVDAGALDAAVAALRMHATAARELELRNTALSVLIMTCSGIPPEITGPPLQASVAARAAQAGVGAALEADLALMPPHPEAVVRTRAAELAAAVARLPPPHACASCGTKDAILRFCARCRKERYCSDACQRAAWPAHKLVCVRSVRARAPDAA